MRIDLPGGLRNAVAVCFLCAAVCPARAAVLLYSSTQRFVQTGDAIVEPPASFAALDMVTPGARQQSSFLPSFVSVLSHVSGAAMQGLSVMKVTFRLTEPSLWSANGSFSLLGESGFACVSLVNLAHHDTLLLNEIAGDPPARLLERSWSASGVLEAGNYTVDAIIYTGGTGAAHSGSLAMHFSIPEPSACGMLLAAGLCWMRARTQGTARTRVNSRLPLPAV